MNDLKFSILIPMYNAEKYINECLDSVLNQTFQNFEIIIINDGSVDSSPIICDNYAKKDKRITIYHQENTGTFLARKKALMKCSGDFFIFLDADDYWNFNLLEVINCTIETYNCDIVLFKFNKINFNNIIVSKPIFEDLKIFENENKKDIFLKIITSSDLNNLCFKAIKRELIDCEEDYKKYVDIKFGEDLIQSLPFLYKAKKIIYIDKPLYNYRTNPYSITYNFDVKEFEYSIRVRTLLLEYIVKIGLNTKKNLTLFYSYLIHILMSYIYKLVNSNINKNIKYDIMEELRNNFLYINALNYKLKLPLRHSISFFLHKKKRYKELILFNVFLDILTKPRNKVLSLIKAQNKIIFC